MFVRQPRQAGHRLISGVSIWNILNRPSDSLASEVQFSARESREGSAAYCFSAGGFASGVGGGPAVGAVPRSPDAAAQSPAHSLVPLTVPTSLQPIGSFGFT